MFEATETSGIKLDNNYHNLSIIHTVELVTMLDLMIPNHIFFLLKCKF